MINPLASEALLLAGLSLYFSFCYIYITMETHYGSGQEKAFYSVEGNPDIKYTGKVESRAGGRIDLLKLIAEKKEHGGWINFKPNTVNGTKELPTFADIDEYYNNEHPFKLYLHETGKLENGIKLKREMENGEPVYKSKELGQTYGLNDELPDDYILEFFLSQPEQPLLKGF